MARTAREQFKDSRRRFKYKEDGDNNGLFFYFAIKGTLNEKNYTSNFANTMDNFRISTHEFGKAFMKIKLNNFYMQLTYCTLFFYLPENMEMRGSVNGQECDRIKLHHHSTTGNKMTFNDKCQQYYYFFNM